MSRAHPRSKHNTPECDDKCTGKKAVIYRGTKSWRYCNCKCHKSRSR